VDFDYVVNCCGETRFGLTEEEYKKKCLDPALKCAKLALEKKVKKFIEISTAQIYEPDSKKAAAEDGKQAPWTILARFRLEAEKKLTEIAGLPLVILRPAYVYGPGDLTSITPRIVCAAVYKDRKEQMKFLWDKNMKINTVHIDDVCAAIWFACTTARSGSVYNLADETNTDQGLISQYLGEIFDIETGFLGGLVSNLAKLKLSAVAEEANDKHVPGWTKICQAHNVQNTPLSPYIDKELLKNNSLCVDGTRITQDGFRYTKPRFTKDLLQTVVDKFVEQGIFPSILKKAAAAD